MANISRENMQALTSHMVVLGVGYTHVSGRKVNV
jgi:hypothetical protein